MKIANMGIVFIGIVVLCILITKNKCSSITEEKDSVVIDSIPTSKYYQKTIVVKSGKKEDLGTNPRLNHNVKCDYDSYNNNWDEDLDKLRE